MIKRCYNPQNQHHSRNYKDRGIQVCERWLKSFYNFFNDMGHPPSEKHTIDRINPRDNYDPLNCRWATYTEQSWNRQNCKGYSWAPNHNKWNAAITANRNRKNIGYFNTKKEARSAYLDAKAIYHQSDMRPEVVRRLHECWTRLPAF
jgi:hypothetical protein